MAKFDPTKLIAHLNQKWGNRPCPMCGISNWQVQNSTFQLIEWDPNALTVGGPVIPVVPVVCANCGNTMLVSAVASGLIKPQAQRAQ